MDVSNINSLAENLTEDKPSGNNTESEFYDIGIFELHILCFSFMIGIPTNSYIIWLIVTGTGSRLASDFLVLNLSICGLFFSVNSLIVFFTKWFLLEILQALSQFFLGLAITGSPLFQCLICVERYLAVVHPVTFLKLKPLRYRVICCAVVWMLILGSCLFCLLCLTFSLTLFTYMWFLSLQFLVFVSINLFCCLAVLRILKQSGPGERKIEENHIKRRALIVILITTVNTIITYVPFAVTGLLAAVTGQLFHFLWSFSYACFILAGFVPAGLYLHRIGKLFCFIFVKC